VEIESLAYGGEGVGRIQKKVVFVPLSAPGDRVEVVISEAKKNYLRGHIERFEALSQNRTVPLCDYFGECGGCQWQHLKYAYQLETKEQIVKNSLERIAKIQNYELLPIVPSPRIFEYRSRVRFQCLTHRKYSLGFFKSNTKEIVSIERCDLLPPFLNHVLRKLKEFLDCLEHLIVINEIEILTNPEKEEGVISFSADTFSRDQIAPFLKSLKYSIPTVYGVAIQTGYEQEVQTEYFGNCTLEFSERIFPQGRSKALVLAKRTHIHTFSQVNLEQNSALIRTMYEWIKPSGAETIVDLFCGMGNLSIPLAQDVRRVIGIENNARAIEDACYNAKSNHMVNSEFYSNDALIGLRELKKQGVAMDVVILDPPRKGCKDLIPEIVECKPSKILYVSCNPATMARDIALFYFFNYRLNRVQPLDMFPQTYHVETIAELLPL
jgi:23S rRNA (uracil1939-C5)-methyltransferase